jgi:hypothetical protein
VDSEEGHLGLGKSTRGAENEIPGSGVLGKKSTGGPENSSGAWCSTIVWLLVLVLLSCGISDEGNIRPLAAGLEWRSGRHGNELAVACVSSTSRITATPRGTAFMRLHGGPGKTGEQRLHLCTREDMWAAGLLTHVTESCNKFPYHRRGNRRIRISAGHDADLYPWPSLDALTYDRDSVLNAVDWNERIEVCQHSIVTTSKERVFVRYEDSTFFQFDPGGLPQYSGGTRFTRSLRPTLLERPSQDRTDLCATSRMTCMSTADASVLAPYALQRSRIDIRGNEGGDFHDAPTLSMRLHPSTLRFTSFFIGYFDPWVFERNCPTWNRELK